VNIKIKKILAIGIFRILFGAGVVPSISGNNENLDNIQIKNGDNSPIRV